MVLPKGWLDQLGMDERADIVLTDSDIRIEPPLTDDGASIEDDPHFATFLDFILADALRRPDELVPADELQDRGRRLVAGVETDD
ncbi:MAG: AbrB/MazE/SpoVT family DNA-binding domain-containing protein [Candidatus Dormibacteria bacterium]